MTKLDDWIKDALSEEERDILRETEELGWFALGVNQFRGKLGWVTWSVMLTQGIIFLVGLWCAWHFFGATETVPALKWGLSAAVLVLTATILKLSLMPQMQADRIMREIKRLELMIAVRRDD